MQVTINIPDIFIDPVRVKLSAGPTGVLEAIALDAVLAYLMKLASSEKPKMQR